jgi:hypothetical protein
MTQSIESTKIWAVFVKVLIVCCLLVAMVLSGKFTDFMNGSGFVFVFLGGITLTLISFTFKEIGLAFKHTSGRTGSAEEQCRLFLGDSRTEFLDDGSSWKHYQLCHRTGEL